MLTMRMSHFNFEDTVLIKLNIYELPHLNIYLLVLVAEDDETVELLLCRATSSDSSTAKTFLELTRQNDKPTKI